jgi:uncharacterized protein
MNIRIPAWCQGESSPDDQYHYLGRPESAGAKITVNGKKAKYHLIRGYASIRRNWAKGDVIELAMKMPIMRVQANPRVEADKGRVALQRGPIVYCVESADNPDGLKQMYIPQDFDPSLKAVWEGDFLSGVNILEGKALRSEIPSSDKDAKEKEGKAKECRFVVIPYYVNGNRTVTDKEATLVSALVSSDSTSHADGGQGGVDMRVWLPEKAEMVFWP